MNIKPGLKLKIRFNYNRKKDLGVFLIYKILWLVMIAFVFEDAFSIDMPVISNNLVTQDISALSNELSSKTSVNDLEKKDLRSSNYEDFLDQPMIWVEDISLILDSNRRIKPRLVSWFKRGGFMVIEQGLALDQIQTAFLSVKGLKVESVDLNSELMKSFYLLSVLPTCTSVNQQWKVAIFDDRIAAVIIPYNYVKTLLEYLNHGKLCSGITGKNFIRSFVNIMMVSLTTDYKNDQTHLPEILKRLR